MNPYFRIKTAVKSSLLMLFSGIFPVLMISCRPSITVNAAEGDSVAVSFSTGFSEEISGVLRSMTGISDNQPVLNKKDAENIIKELGAVESAVKLPSQNEIEVRGKIMSISKNIVSDCGFIKKTTESLSFTIGPEQLLKFYDFLSEDYKALLDLMMIPALIGEKMSVSEYETLLSSMYGPSFAKEIVNGELTVLLSSPDGKKLEKETVSLGEILTLNDVKEWKVSW